LVDRLLRQALQDEPADESTGEQLPEDGFVRRKHVAINVIL
jgi:hypothetical protein